MHLQDGPAIVAGHSYGGQVMTALGADAPNVSALVYIAAFGLDQGESLGGLLAQGPVTPGAWWTLVAVCLGTFMLLLDITIVKVALPDIQRALHSSFADLQWVVDAYALTLASFLLTAGSLADMYGRHGHRAHQERRTQ